MAYVAVQSALWFLTMYRVQQIEARLRQLDDQAAQQRLMNRLATAQIHPHFVFNTLASLTQWVETGDARAAPLLREFAAYLRATLPMFEREQQPLRDELDLVRHYLAIMAARLGERLQWQVDVDPALEPLPVPPGSLLTWWRTPSRTASNPRCAAARCGLARAGGRAAVLEVPQQSAARWTPRHDGLGLSNTRQRLLALHPDGRLQLAPDPRGRRLHRAHRIPHPRTMTTQILIADDEEAPREHLRRLLAGAWPDAELVAACANGVDAWDERLAHEPAVCFLDIRMPGLTGLEVAQRLQALAAPPQVVFVTAYNDHALAAFEAGAADYLVKPLDLERLQRLRGAAQGPPGQQQRAGRPRPAATAGPAAAGASPRRMKPIQASLGKEGAAHPARGGAVLRERRGATPASSRQEGEALIRTPLKELVAGLDPELFWQVHRSVLVNSRCIASRRAGRREQHAPHAQGPRTRSCR
jgi:CheY-like chemotaxis protein